MTQQWLYHGETDDAHVRGAACPRCDGWRPFLLLGPMLPAASFPAYRPLRAEKEATNP